MVTTPNYNTKRQYTAGLGSTTQKETLIFQSLPPVKPPTTSTLLGGFNKLNLSDVLNGVIDYFTPLGLFDHPPIIPGGTDNKNTTTTTPEDKTQPSSEEDKYKEFAGMMDRYNKENGINQQPGPLVTQTTQTDPFGSMMPMFMMMMMIPLMTSMTKGLGSSDKKGRDSEYEDGYYYP